jgi:hypothetical protein
VLLVTGCENGHAMTPERTGGKKGGNFRFDREFADVGRIRNSSGTERLSEFKKRDAILTKLHENAQLDVLRAFMRGELSIEQLVAADRSGKLASAELLSELKLQQNLWTAIDDALPRMGKGEETRRRYETSLRKLQLHDRSAPVGDRARRGAAGARLARDRGLVGRKPGRLESSPARTLGVPHGAPGRCPSSVPARHAQEDHAPEREGADP